KIKQNYLKLNLKPKNIINKIKIMIKDKKEFKQTLKFILIKTLIELDKILKINEGYLIVGKCKGK
ncbi:MAG: hypothetical protein ACP5H9_02605, partial [Candidatus Woesearchaeota archaeon]